MEGTRQGGYVGVIIHGLSPWVGHQGEDGGGTESTGSRREKTRSLVKTGKQWLSL